MNAKQEKKDIFFQSIDVKSADCRWVLVVKNSPANTGDVKEVGSNPGLGRSPGGGDGNPLQDLCLENPTGRGAWQAQHFRVRQDGNNLAHTTHSAEST